MKRSLLIPLVLMLGCKTCKREVEPPPVVEPPPPVQEAPKPSVAPEPVQRMAKNFNRVFFEFDSATLTADGKAALDENATIMQEFSDIKLEVQGHADERGTTEYNLALGQKRADAVVQYMLAKGISSSRVKSVSYGEERPLDGQTSEQAWSQNRRAEFRIVYKPGDAPVQGTAP
ncbi:MAG: peptidoglycan-associated lipoprotein Pal [Myxococcota bacterium]